MRGQATDPLTDPQTKTKLDNQAQLSSKYDCKTSTNKNGRSQWSRHWHNFTSWGMEEGEWKEETKFLEKGSLFQFCTSSIIEHQLNVRLLPLFYKLQLV
jgi:hypothetical protein